MCRVQVDRGKHMRCGASMSVAVSGGCRQGVDVVAADRRHQVGQSCRLHLRVDRQHQRRAACLDGSVAWRRLQGQGHVGRQGGRSQVEIPAPCRPVCRPTQPSGVYIDDLIDNLVPSRQYTPSNPSRRRRTCGRRRGRLLPAMRTAAALGQWDDAQVQIIERIGGRLKAEL